MVNNEGQFYTIEGIAGAVLIVVTAYLIVGATTLYTPQDVHVSDMQLEQLGYDVLKIMDAPVKLSAESPLEEMVRTNNISGFNSEFLMFVNNRTYGVDTLQYSATIYFRNKDQEKINQTLFFQSRSPSGNENGVRVSRWVYINYTLPNSNIINWTSKPSNEQIQLRNQTVLLEVFLWRE